MADGLNRNAEADPLSPEKQRLLVLEHSGQYLFHGTAADVDTLEPRQAVDTESGPDGEPAVFASSKADYAIFMAIVNSRNCPGGSRSNAGAIQHVEDNGQTWYELQFGMTKDTSDRLAESATGWVYVFNKNDFESHKTKEGVEFISHSVVTPVEKVKVAKRDLPDNIQIN